MSMTTDQIAMARRALGLPNDQNRSYRNRYAVGLETRQLTEWDDLVRQGLAERTTSGITVVGYRLTEKGATAVLAHHETLDPEDFWEAATEGE